MTANLQFNIDYENKESVQELLGGAGQTVLDQVLHLANTVSKKRGWPLTKVRLQRYKDYELPSWGYILVIIVFDCTFEVADEYLHEFYKHSDNLTSQLDGKEKEAIYRLLSFDIESTA